MKFVVSSTELLNRLQAVSKVISSKNTLPILDNFLFQLTEEKLTVTASDLETTMITELELENIEGEGEIAVPAKLLTDTLKEFPEQPLTFEIDNEAGMILIFSETGKFSIPGMNGDDFPKIPELDEDAAHVTLGSDILFTGINKTLFATADDELRPVMNGIFIQLTSGKITFVASDAHKLVRYRRTDVDSESEADFILPKKPAALIKNIIDKVDHNVSLQFDDRNAFIVVPEFKIVCRLIEGEYPKYENVIPVDSPNKMIIDRVGFFNTLKRVSVFSNQASNLVKLKLSNNQIIMSAQDIDFSISAYEKQHCQYEGDEMEIGFKSTFLIEILSNLPGADVVLEMADPSRAGILVPFDKSNDNEDMLMLLMPMMVS